jgi:hypothetical protein
VRPELVSHWYVLVPLPSFMRTLSLGNGHPSKRFVLNVPVANMPVSFNLMQSANDENQQFVILISTS